jgi:hypothetical protein
MPYYKGITPQRDAAENFHPLFSVTKICRNWKYHALRASPKRCCRKFSPFVFVFCDQDLQKLKCHTVRASPSVLSMWLQIVKFIVEKSKCAGLAQEIAFSAPNSRSLPWLVKGATQLCTSEKELVDHNDWSRWFAIIVPTYMQFQLQVYWWCCQKKETAKLRHLIWSHSATKEPASRINY